MMYIDNHTDHGKAQAGTGNAARFAGAAPVESFKDMGQVLRGNPGSVIGDEALSIIVGCTVQGDPDAAIFFSVFIGVVNEVADSSFDQHFVGHNAYAAFDI